MKYPETLKEEPKPRLKTLGDFKPVVIKSPEVDKIMRQGAGSNVSMAILVEAAPPKHIGTFVSRLNQMVKVGGAILVKPNPSLEMHLLAYGFKTKEKTQEGYLIYSK